MSSPRTRDQLLEAYQPFLEADLGLRRRILLSSKQLEWRPRSGRPVVTQLARIDRVRLLSRPVWESLAVGAMAFVGLLVASTFAVRALCAAVALLAVAACFLQRRYALVLIMRDGTMRGFDLGIGTRRSPLVQRIDSVWESLRPALAQVGVKT